MKNLARVVILSLVRLPKDWFRGLAIIVLFALLINLVVNPISGFIQDMSSWPLFGWVNKNYRITVICLMLFIALPILFSRIWPLITAIRGKIWIRKRGWKPALYLTENLVGGLEAWPIYVTGTWDTRIDGKDKTLLSILKITSPTPFTGFPLMVEPKNVFLVKNFDSTEWGTNAILWFTHNQKKSKTTEEKIPNLVLERYSDAV